MYCTYGFLMDGSVLYLWCFRDGGVLYLWFFDGRWCIVPMVFRDGGVLYLWGFFLEGCVLYLWFFRDCGSRGGGPDHAAVLSVWGHGQHGVTDGVHRSTYVITIIYKFKVICI